VSLNLSLTACCDGDPAVYPEFFRMDSWEQLPLTFDCSSVVDVGQGISMASAQLIQLTTGRSYLGGLYGPVQVSGTDLTQIVYQLVPPNRYRLVMQFQTAPQTIWAPYLIIECVA
jgi:hypothetical protein